MKDTTAPPPERNYRAIEIYKDVTRGTSPRDYFSLGL